MPHNQYRSDAHDAAVACPAEECGVKNAPRDSRDWAPHCWRCGAELPRAFTEGQLVAVTVTDQRANGTLVCEPETGPYVFVEADIAVSELVVEITQTGDSYAVGEPTDAPVPTPDASEPDTGPDPRLGSREDFWDEPN